MVVLALAVGIWAFLGAGRSELPVAERRPAPGDGSTHEVGDIVVGDAAPAAYEDACQGLRGIRIAGDELDQRVLGRAVDGLCALDLSRYAALRRFAEQQGVVRFAVFERTGVDSTARWEGADGAPLVLVNAKFSRTDPLWVSPLVVHDAVLLEASVPDALAAVMAREAEHAACQRLFQTRRPSRGCEDAAELLALEDPVAALRAAGWD